MQKQLEEERARVPKANPYPYTTDYPVVHIFIYICLILKTSNCNGDGTMILLLNADPTKARAQGMHKTGTFPTRELSEA